MHSFGQILVQTYPNSLIESAMAPLSARITGITSSNMIITVIIWPFPKKSIKKRAALKNFQYVSTLIISLGMVLNFRIAIIVIVNLLNQTKLKTTAQKYYVDPTILETFFNIMQD